jgi:hypothetical protein
VWRPYSQGFAAPQGEKFSSNAFFRRFPTMNFRRR